MAEFTAQDVKRLRDMTGAGMMDAKRALTENDGDFQSATTWLRENGLGKAGERSGRENTQGAVAVARDGNAAALVQLRSETDFVAKSPQFVEVVTELAELVAKAGEGAVSEKADAIDDLKVTLKENIELGKVVRYEAGDGQALDTYLHVQAGRGVNGIIVVLDGGSEELAHEVALAAAFHKPGYVSRDEVPADEADAEREQLLKETQNEGKPEQAWPKIVEGKLNGWFKRSPGGVLLDQPYPKDEKQSIQQLVGDAKIVHFAQVVIGS